MASNGRTYVVTGASSGIGLELVRQLAARGDKVFATVRKKESSLTKIDEISAVEGDVTIIEGVDVTNDKVANVLAGPLTGVEIDMVVHNAGGVNATRQLKGMETMSDQSIENISMDRMMRTYNLNALGPLRIQQALSANIKSPGGKVAVISSGMGSIGDNNSGGLYAYRASKAAVNMITKGMSVDLKRRGIAVVAVNPGMVITNFGPGSEAMAKMGAMPVAKSCEGLIKVFDDLNIENTGRFMSVSKSAPPKEFSGGW